MQFPDMKVKDVDIQRARQLKNDLNSLENKILEFSPKNITKRKLRRLKFRIFTFPKQEDCNEYYFTHRNAKYVCLNANLLKRSYYAALQFTLHGIAHSFCHLKDSIAEEAFCEYVGYSILEDFVGKKGNKIARKAIRSGMRFSKKDYNTYFRAVRKLDKKNPGFLLKLNAKAKNRKLSRKGEKKVIARYLKVKKNFVEDEEFDLPNLEKGFRKV